MPPPAASHPAERRRHPRFRAELPCKVLPEAAARYDTGRTIDVSVGGALIVLNAARAVSPGARIKVAVTPEFTPIIREGDVRTAVVVRVDPSICDDLRRIAVCFENPAGEAFLAAA